MQNIITKIRAIIEDNEESCSDIFTYLTTGASKIFTLTRKNPDSSTVLVYKNGILWANTNYSFNSINNKLTITGTLVAGDTLEITYIAYLKYSNTLLKKYIKAALSYISKEHYKDFKVSSDSIFPTPTEAEENMIALICAVLINKSIRIYRTPELTIEFIEKETIEEKIEKIVLGFKRSLGVIDFHDLYGGALNEIDLP